MSNPISSFKPHTISSPPPSTSALNQRFTIAPIDLYQSNTRWTTIWTVAKTVSVAAFITIGVLAFVFTSAWNPENIFFLTVGISVGIELTSKLCSYFDKKISHCKQEASKCKCIAEIYDKLIKQSPTQLKRTFNKHGIYQFHKMNDNLITLSKGLAYYLYTNETTIELHKEMKNHIKLAQRSECIADKRYYSHNAFLYDQAAIISRVHAAYDFALLQHPFLKKSLSDIGSIEDRDLHAVCLDKFYGGDDSLFCFHRSKESRSKIAPLTCNQLSRSVREIVKNPEGGPGSLRELSKRLFAAA
ncbi:MAG: hypothetical protein KGZ39_00005 [Simkania sp.]|nr:hypothetical protein [Simkania sp.]